MHSSDTALLTIAAATAAGLLGQLLGHRWRLPAIVPLLAFGVLVGPSVLGVVHPEALAGLPVIVKLAVAVILFAGALNLRLGDLRRAMHEVRAAEVQIRHEADCVRVQLAARRALADFVPPAAAADTDAMAS